MFMCLSFEDQQQKLDKLRRLKRLLKIMLIAAAHHVVANERADIVSGQLNAHQSVGIATFKYIGM